MVPGRRRVDRAGIVWRDKSSRCHPHKGLGGFSISISVKRYDTLPLAKHTKLYNSSIGDLLLNTKFILTSLYHAADVGWYVLDGQVEVL